MRATVTSRGLVTIYYPDCRYAYKVPWKSNWELEGMSLPVIEDVVRLAGERDIPMLRALLLTGGGWP